MVTNSIRRTVEDSLSRGNGILRMRPAWVARDFLPPGRRLGLKENEYDVGERGWISERWLGSTTKADNPINLPDEGLSYLALENEHLTLRDAIESAGDLIMGEEYARTHEGLGRLAKIYDLAGRIPFHIHQRREDAALVGRNSKEEAYYFPEDVDLGPHPETFFGVHPSIVEKKQFDLLLPYLVEWKNDLILRHSRAYLLVPGEGFHLPAGVPHSPGTALTIELQEDSDVSAIFQALVAGKIVSKEYLYKDIQKELRMRYGERAALDQVDWGMSGDPYFYENRHTVPQRVVETRLPGGEEQWIYYNTYKFSGKKLVVKPGQKFTSIDKGVYNILVWRGHGLFDGHVIDAGDFNNDELLVSYVKATTPIQVENTGKHDLVIMKFFGPDINLDVPIIPHYGNWWASNTAGT